VAGEGKSAGKELTKDTGRKKAYHASTPKAEPMGKKQLESIIRPPSPKGARSSLSPKVSRGLYLPVANEKGSHSPDLPSPLHPSRPSRPSHPSERELDNRYRTECLK
jgi:hypothetical protein